MAVRDLLWGCPLCRAPAGIRPVGRRERCRACGAEFRRGRGSTIVARMDGSTRVRSAGDWLAILGAVEAPRADDDGHILGPEPVRVKQARQQNPLRYSGELLGWVEVYEKPQRGTMSLRVDGLHFQPGEARALHWAPGDITGLQPASSSLQLGLRGQMASVKFLEGSVRLWTRALSDLLRDHYRRSGRDVLELQPFVRTCIMQGTPRE